MLHVVCFAAVLQARFVPTLVLERLRAVGEAAAVPKKPSMEGSDTAAMAVDAAEGINSPKVGSSVRAYIVCLFQLALAR